ncbi:MAG: hypothetical protein H6Q44_2015, partial [Deltaproteobacteria bacterium]|nr:hypothetical protein [Deltaproteobacteria bacterium]
MGIPLQELEVRRNAILEEMRS